MTNDQEIKKKIEEQCQVDVAKIATTTIVGGAFGVVNGMSSGVPGMIQQGASGAIIGFTTEAAAEKVSQQICKDKIIQEAQKPKEDPKPLVIEAQAPAPVIYTPPKPVNANANYTVAMNANRDRFMVRGGYRF